MSTHHPQLSADADPRLTDRPVLRRLALLADARRHHGAATPAGSGRAAALRLATFVIAGVLVVGIAPGTDGLDHLGSWWADPVAYQKFAIWALLWELLGLGGGAPALSARPVRRLGTPVAWTHWLRPGTVRLAPWPGKVLATAGTRRRRADVGLYAVTVLLAVVLVLGPTPHGGLPRPLVWTFLAVLAVLGLRDKVPFLAARPDVYLPLLLVFGFAPGNTVFGAKVCLAGWLCGRALAGCTPHFASVVALGAGDAPWRRLPVFAPRIAGLWSGPPHAPVASPSAHRIGWALSAALLVVPLLALLARGGWLSVAAVVLLVALQLLTLSSLPVDPPVETGAFLVYSTVALFGRHAGEGSAGLHSWTLTILLTLVLGGRVLLGAVRPKWISPVMSLRFHSGTESASLWLLRDDAPDPLGVSGGDVRLATRCLLPRVGALLGLHERAVGTQGRYRAVDGELIAEAALGWRFGDGRLHGTALMDAVRRRTDYGPGQLRIVTLAAQGLGQRVHYRITDAATGKLEEGTVAAADVLAYRPFDREQVPLTGIVTFHRLPPIEMPKVVPPARPSPGPRATGHTVRLGAEGAGARHRPRPGLTQELPG